MTFPICSFNPRLLHLLLVLFSYKRSINDIKRVKQIPQLYKVSILWLCVSKPSSSLRDLRSKTTKRMVAVIA
uniref:Uncharacterized protein n=1 Tax=Solanum tuberosum TaxID=4113 RepID=M1B673_SOLTU